MTKNTKCYAKIFKKFDFLHFTQKSNSIFVGYHCKRAKNHYCDSY